MFHFPLLGELIKLIKKKRFDDKVNSLHSYYTPILMLFFALLISAKQYVGKPIQCWVPKEFRESWEDYVESYCFVQNTFYVPIDSRMAPEDEREDLELTYYQWVPLMLTLQAAMFYFPKLIWSALVGNSIDLDHVVEESIRLRTTPYNERPKRVETLCGYLAEHFPGFKTSRTRWTAHFGAASMSRLSIEFLLVKLIYLSNLVAQLWLISQFIGTDFLSWGYGLAVEAVTAASVPRSPEVFPVVTNCDFLVRRLANVNRYSVQCVLMVNVYNERIYTILWAWFMFLAAVTCLNLLYNVSTHLVPSVREWLVIRKLVLVKNVQSRNLVLHKFCQHGLKADGALLLRIIQSHAGPRVARTIAANLYDIWAIGEERSTTFADDQADINAKQQHSSNITTVWHGLGDPDIVKKAI